MSTAKVKREERADDRDHDGTTEAWRAAEHRQRVREMTAEMAADASLGCSGRSDYERTSREKTTPARITVEPRGELGPPSMKTPRKALLDFPIPELEVTLQEVGRVLKLTLNPDLYPEFINTLDQQREVLEAAQKKFATSASGHENWGTEQFKSQLLSCSDPLPTSTALPVVFPPTRTRKDCTQLERAAALLWGVAKLYSCPSLVEGDVTTERTQQSEIFAACRLPGTQQDEIKMYPDSIHAIVLCVGGVFPIDIMCRSSSSSDGPMSPRPLFDIYNQLAQAMSHASSTKSAVICGLSALERKSWAAIREEILKQGDTAAGSLGLMESAVVALSLEDCNAPPEMASILNTVRLGGGDGPCLRYYDKVVNLVVFKDSTAGMVFEHSAVDGMVAGLVSECVYHLSETVIVNLDHNDPGDHSRSDTENNVNDVNSSPLQFPLQGIKTNPSPSLKATHPSSVITLVVSSYPDEFSALRGQRGLYDAWINFSLQLSLRQTFGESAANHILVTPTHMRHYKHGRCDPTYSLTMRSRELVGILASSAGPEYTPQYTTQLLQLFHVAFLEHKKLIKATKSGQGVGRHLAALRWSMPSDNPLKKFLDHFGCPSVYLTGKDLMEGIECAVGNVYAKDQLAVTYLGRRDKVLVVLNAKGSFATMLEKLCDSLTSNMKLVMLLALRYSIACQMGALECVLQDGQVGPMHGEVNRSVEGHLAKTKHNSDSMSPDFTLVIHGGAGDEMMLNSKVVEVIEFALQTALGLGSQVLQHGGSSLDAVQKSVEALENCFLFNAGKDGKNEMEATIVDGSRIYSGSVACLQRVKKPIKAARCVMEESPHSMIVGDGAEDFVQGLEPGKPLSSKSNHPQTVGAVALDRWHKLAATSTGSLVGKLKGRVGDTALVGAGIYGDDKLAIFCSGDGDVFLRHTVAQQVASLYHHKGYTLRKACREVISENLKGICVGIIAVDSKGEVVIETNAGVMFVASMVGGITRVEVLRPMNEISNRCALVFNPTPDHPAKIKLLPLHGLEPNWHPYVSKQEDFKACDPGYCSSKSGPRWQDGLLDQVQVKVMDKLPTPNAPSCYDYLGDHSSDDLFSHIDADYTALIQATYKVAKLLEEGMGAQGVTLIFEGFEIDYAHAKMILLVPAQDGSKPEELQPKHFTKFPLSSLNGPAAKPEALEKIHSTITQNKPPGSWQEPQIHSMIAIRCQWYHNMFQIQTILFHSTVEYFHTICQYSVLTI
ncbi:Isoaspartyl peptidase [Merluccius polli]|uniref:Isoaspartyl peptidase n=1 Tax=Merluccius polli TaxID=89951 RepID=A0AA47MET5_MERPO|nr:Isoaspartyl peptidase [Merluccius polli]